MVVYTLRGQAAATEKLAGPPGGLLILAFWATWCASCTYNFRRLEELPGAFAGRLEVLLVNAESTGDDPEKIKAFFQQQRSGADLPTVVGDTVLRRLFPHNHLPHYVWIREGRVVAITGSDEVTADNIHLLLQGQSPPLRHKNDLLGAHRPGPLFTPEAEGAPIRYRSMIAGYIEGLSAGTVRHHDTARGWYRLCHTNLSVLGLFQQAYGSVLPRNRVVLEVREPAAVDPPGEWNTWKGEHAWTYELLVPAEQGEAVLSRMRTDLEQYFGYRAVEERRPLKVWVLRRGKGQLPRSLGGTPAGSLGEGANYLRNQPLHYLVEWLNHHWDQPVLDGSSYTFPVDMELPANLQDEEAVRATLIRYGFDLVPMVRELEVLVLKEVASKAGAGVMSINDGFGARSDRAESKAQN
jgi:thiol-disulfide isomerase/thioredoxin